MSKNLKGPAPEENIPVLAGTLQRDCLEQFARCLREVQLIKEALWAAQSAQRLLFHICPQVDILQYDNNRHCDYLLMCIHQHSPGGGNGRAHSRKWHPESSKQV